MSFTSFTAYALPLASFYRHFFIWDKDEISLQSFLEFCNSYSTNKKTKSTINFTFSYSKQEVIFLDTKVSFQHSVLVSQLYSKATSAHQYLQRNPFHPHSLLKSIPKFQFIRIRRICTHPSDYWLHASKFLDHFSAGGFRRVKLQQQARSVATFDRENLLCLPIDNLTKKQDRKPFVMFWHSKGPVKLILRVKIAHLIVSFSCISSGVNFRIPKKQIQLAVKLFHPQDQ